MEHRLSDEELLKLISIAKSESAPNENLELSEAERYVISRGIKAGKERISPTQVYLDYVQWNSKPINRDTFFKQFCKIFPRHINGGGRKGRYFLLDPATFDMSLDTHFKMRAELRKIRERKKEAHQAKRRALSGSGTGSESQD